MIRLIPPIAVPVSVWEVVTSLIAHPGHAPGQFARHLAARFGADEALLFGSGRAALASVLSAIPKAERDEVLLPAYTCWTVPAAVVQAGLKVRLYDIDPHSFLPSEELSTRIGSRTAAVVLADLLSPAAGYEAVAAELATSHRDCSVIEDRAQAWPARIPLHEIALLSFGRGKPLPLGGGGAILTRGPRHPATAREMRSGGTAEAAALAATVLLGQSSVFRLPSAIPALGIGSTVFDPAFDADRPFHPWQDRLGVRLLARMEEMQENRTRNASQLVDFIADVEGWTVGPWSRGPLRLPVYGPDRRSRDRMATELRRIGVSASSLYPGTVRDIPALRPHLAENGAVFPGADQIAERLLTLPVHPTLAEKDVARIGCAFRRAAKAILR